MNFYTSISKYYESIFPLQHIQVEFVKSYIDTGNNTRLLDIGCATGALSNELSPYVGEIVGIDLDTSMLHQASSGRKNTLFQELNMLDIEKQYGSQSYDMMLCFGNTLVHLQSEEEVNSFLAQAKTILKPSGIVLIQIINYDRIFNLSLPGLSSIENDTIKFERYYDYAPNDSHVQFRSTLTTKQDMQEYNNSVQLLALRKHQLVNMLSNAGFKNIELFGNYQKADFNMDSIPLIVKASA